MDITAPDSVAPKNTKYEKGLDELEKLKKRAKETKPKVRGSYFFINVVTTSLLFFILFLIGFGISYNNTKRKLELETAKITPKAQIKLPKIQNSRCKPVYVLNDTNKDHKADCASTKTQEECLSIDLYNELLSDFSGGDTKPDCTWN